MHKPNCLPSYRRWIHPKFVLIAACFCFSSSLQAQITNVLFFEDFQNNTINPAKLVPDAPFFEGGQGDIQATAIDGMVEFTGMVSQQWWAGATLRVVPTFTVSDANQVAVEVDRVFEGGVGTASRSALWIMDETQTRYILFADVRGEAGWRYNRKIGLPGDVPTGGGTEMTQLNDAEDGALHVMKAVANGETVTLYLDDRFGATVPFPYTNLVFHIGSYARATDDTAHTQFDNLRVYSIGAATFQPTRLTATSGLTLSNIVVRIPAGLNASSAVQLRVVTSDPTVALPVGAVGDTLTLTFAAGATNAQTIAVQAAGPVGGAELTLTNNVGLQAGNSLDVTVISPPGVRLVDDFTGAALDPLKWERNDASFEVGTGAYELTQGEGRLTLSGFGTGQYWGGVSARSVPVFTATGDLPLTVEVDRVGISRLRSLDGFESSAARSTLWLANNDRSQFIAFSQNLGENGWQVNVNIAGAGADIAAFNDLDLSTNSHRMKLVADGEGVDVYLDDEFGGRFAFRVSSGLHVELGAYTRDFDDEVIVNFDNVRVENALPCISLDASDVDVNLGENSKTVTVTIPRLLNLGAAASVTITSQNPAVAIPAGAVGGALTLNFPAGSATEQTFTVQTAGLGATTFSVATQGTCVPDGVDVTVTAVPDVLLVDSFSAGTLSNHWAVDEVPLVDGAAMAGSGVAVNSGAVSITVTNEFGSWAGFAVYTTNSYSATITEPAIFEIDRDELDFVLVTGTAAKQQTGIWITDTTRSRYVFFTEYATHDGTAGGWQYFRALGETTDIPVTGPGIGISAFTEARFNDRGSHRLRAVANGNTVKLYIDGTFGAEVDFPVSNGIVFGFGAYVLAATDVVVGTFDDATVLGGGDGGGGGARLSVATAANGDITISWDASGTLQSRDNLAAGGSWVNVTPAPAGNSYTIPRLAQTTQRFFRVAQ